MICEIEPTLFEQPGFGFPLKGASGWCFNLFCPANPALLVFSIAGIRNAGVARGDVFVNLKVGFVFGSHSLSNATGPPRFVQTLLGRGSTGLHRSTQMAAGQK